MPIYAADRRVWVITGQIRSGRENDLSCPYPRRVVDAFQVGPAAFPHTITESSSAAFRPYRRPLLLLVLVLVLLLSCFSNFVVVSLLSVV